MVKNAFSPPNECPVCGEAVPTGAQACPGCGADERSGWDEEAARYDGLDLPDEAFGVEPAPRARKIGNPGWLVVTVLVLVALIITFVFR